MPNRAEHLISRSGGRTGRDSMGMIYNKIGAEINFKTVPTPVTTSQSPASLVLQQLLMSPKSLHRAVSDEDQGCHMMLWEIFHINHIIVPSFLFYLSHTVPFFLFSFSSLLLFVIYHLSLIHPISTYHLWFIYGSLYYSSISVTFIF